MRHIKRPVKKCMRPRTVYTSLYTKERTGPRVRARAGDYMQNGTNAACKRVQRRVRRRKRARRAASPPRAALCGAAIRCGWSKRKWGGARAKSAARLQAAPVNAVKKHQLEVLQVDVPRRPASDAPGQCGSQALGQQESAEKRSRKVDGATQGVGQDGHFTLGNGHAAAEPRNRKDTRTHRVQGSRVARVAIRIRSAYRSMVIKITSAHVNVMSMSTSRQLHVEVEVRAPSEDICRHPMHPRIKDGHESGQKGRVQRRAAVAQAVGRACSRDQAG